MQILRTHSPQSETTIHGKDAIVFGALFVIAGVSIVLFATGVIPAKRSSPDAPHWVVMVCGAIFAAPGAWLVLHGFRGMRVRRRSAISAEPGTAEPWRVDYPWDEHGARDLQKRGVGQMLFAMLFMILFAAPANYIAYKGVSQGSSLGYVFAGIDLFVAIYVIAFASRLVRWLKYGTGRLQFRRFPFHLGHTLEIDYLPARPLAGIEKLVCTLRCVREAYESGGRDGDEPERIVSYELFHETKEIDAAALAASFNRSIALAFDLPKDGQSTRLSGRPPTYWELAVSAQTRGLNLDSRFLLPVY